MVSISFTTYFLLLYKVIVLCLVISLFLAAVLKGLTDFI